MNHSTQEDEKQIFSQDGGEMMTMMTQTQELTQLGCGGDLSASSPFAASPMPPSPLNLKTIPWARLVSCSKTGVDVDLLPREPIITTQQQSSSLPPLDPIMRDGISFLGMSNIHASDEFNEYVLGRSPKAHVIVTKPTLPHTTSSSTNPASTKQAAALHDWAHAMISNRHCRIFCMLTSSSSSCSTTDTTSSMGSSMQVFLQDTSGNGTYVNQTVPLMRGQSRLLHTGDQICLVNPQHLRKKIRSETALQHLLQHYSFVFINLYQQQQHVPVPLLPLSSRGRMGNGDSPPIIGDGVSSSELRPTPARNGVVNVRAMKHPSQHQQHDDGMFSPPDEQLTSHNGHQQHPRPQQPSTTTTTTVSTNLHRRIEQEYDMRDVLGSGTCGQVRRAIHRLTGREVAVKMIPIGRTRPRPRPATALFGPAVLPPESTSNNNNNNNMEATLLAEANILRALDHPYIVKLYDVFMVPGDDVMYLVMELLQGGDLFDRIVLKGKYSEDASRKVMRRLLHALYYLHEERNIVHRDLKPENILLVDHHNDIAIKLTDFGLAKSITDDGLKTFCGTPAYFAPEVLKRRHTVTGRGRYGKKADMWSVGVILYVLLSGTPPFEDDDGGALMMSHEERSLTFPPCYWHGISESAKDLVRQLLIDDPRQRLSVQEACDHVWLSMEDGDTHTHPLQDPAAPIPLRQQRRLFASPASHNTTTTSSSTTTLPMLFASTKKTKRGDGTNMTQSQESVSMTTSKSAEPARSATVEDTEPATTDKSSPPPPAGKTSNVKHEMETGTSLEKQPNAHQKEEEKEPPSSQSTNNEDTEAMPNELPLALEETPTPRDSANQTSLQPQEDPLTLPTQSPVKEIDAVTSPCSCMSEMRHTDIVPPAVFDNGTPPANTSMHPVSSSSSASPPREPLSPILVQGKRIPFRKRLNDEPKETTGKAAYKKKVVKKKRESRASESVSTSKSRGGGTTKRKQVDFVATELSDDEVCSQFSDDDLESNVPNSSSTTDRQVAANVDPADGGIQSQPKRLKVGNQSQAPSRRQRVRIKDVAKGHENHDGSKQTDLSKWIKKK